MTMLDGMCLSSTRDNYGNVAADQSRSFKLPFALVVMSSYDYGGFSYNPNNNAYGYNQESFQDGTNSAAYNNNNTDAGYGYDFANYAHQNAYGQGYDSKAQAASNHDYLNTGFLSTPAAQIGMQVGSQALSAGQSYVNSNVQSNYILFPLIPSFSCNAGSLWRYYVSIFM